MTHAASAVRPSTNSDDSTTSSDSSTTRGDGYIHVVGWEKFQHYQTGRNSKQTDMKWILMEFTRNDAVALHVGFLVGADDLAAFPLVERE